MCESAIIECSFGVTIALPTKSIGSSTRRWISDGFFVAYLSDFPHLKINHSVLVYGQKKSRRGADLEHYITYDPNHPDGPRELTWSNSKREFNFQKDEEFPGGFTNVFQVYGKWLQ